MTLADDEIHIRSIAHRLRIRGFLPRRGRSATLSGPTMATYSAQAGAPRVPDRHVEREVDVIMVSDDRGAVAALVRHLPVEYPRYGKDAENPPISQDCNSGVS